MHSDAWRRNHPSSARRLDRGAMTGERPDDGDGARDAIEDTGAVGKICARYVDAARAARGTRGTRHGDGATTTRVEGKMTSD